MSMAETVSSETSPIVPVIICGGAGSRLWPASREAFPKQFIALLGEESMFQKTLARVREPFFDWCVPTYRAMRAVVRREVQIVPERDALEAG